MIFVFDFSHQYDYLREQADYYSDCSFIHGTNAYCSDEAANELKAEVSKALSSVCQIDAKTEEARDEAIKALTYGIHFIDSGNYHYMSLFFLERIETDFNLLLIDNHTDMNENAFGDILSCGNWVRKALFCLPHLKTVYMLGVKKQYFQEMKDMLISDGELIENPEDEKEQKFTLECRTGNLRKKILYITSSDQILEKIKKDTPLYISLDKDALSDHYAITDWDQGEMTIDELGIFMKELNQNSIINIIGLDICGDTKEGSSLNCNINKKILSFISNQ